jgi:hypothetical protein
LDLKEFILKPIRIVDRPCGTGKTSDLLTSFKPHEKYIVIVPYLTEVDRVVSDAVCDFYAPQVDEESSTKRQSLLELAIEGKNIATTHKMFESLVSVCRQGYLDDYNLIIDEVPETIKVAYTLSKASINEIYLDGGYLDVDSTGLVKLTPKWELKQEEFKDTLSSKLMAQASTGCLYLSENQFFLWCMPIELLTSCFSTTILTYKSGGSVLCKYLDKEGIPYVVDYSSVADEEFKAKARELISIEDLPNAISGLKWSFNKQSELKLSQCKRVQTALKNLRARQLLGIEPNDIMLTCSKDLWNDEPRGRGIKVGSRLYQANWIANTTRGTNAFSHCSHAIYLYDQHLNPAIVRWLNVENRGAFDNDYALSEFIQWLYRSRVRKGEPVTVFFASSRMRSLVENWLYSDA